MRCDIHGEATLCPWCEMAELEAESERLREALRDCAIQLQGAVEYLEDEVDEEDTAEVERVLDNARQALQTQGEGE